MENNYFLQDVYVKGEISNFKRHQSGTLYFAIKDKVPVSLLSKESNKMEKGIVITTFYLAKGLEFDGVIVADGENYLNIEDNNLFYTVCTRALHKLVIFSSKSLENILPQSKSLYDIV